MLRRFASCSMALLLAGVAGCSSSDGAPTAAVSAGAGGSDNGLAGAGGSGDGGAVSIGGTGGSAGTGGTDGGGGNAGSTGGVPGVGGSTGGGAGGAATGGASAGGSSAGGASTGGNSTGGASAGGASAGGASTGGSASGGFGGNTDVGICVASFGNGMSNTYGRLDGTLVAIVRPQDQQCAMPNKHHTILEIQMMGAAYRLLINVDDSQSTDPSVLFAELDAPMPGAPFAEGWHTTGVSLDYVKDLALASTDFTSMEPPVLVEKIVSELTLGDPVSVFNQGFGPDGGHNIHRYGQNEDGAVFLHPKDAKSHVLVFHFQNQTF